MNYSTGGSRALPNSPSIYNSLNSQGKIFSFNHHQILLYFTNKRYVKLPPPDEVMAKIICFHQLFQLNYPG